MIDFETWKTFIAAVDSGSLLQSARILQIDVSTASRRLKKLEEQLKLQLFYRDSSGIFPTTAGQTLLAQIKPVIEEINATLSELSTDKVKLCGHYLIELSPELAYSNIWNIFATLELHNPELSFSFVIQTAHKEILSYTPDLQLQIGENIHSDSIHIGHLPVICVASPSYLEMKGVPQTPEEIPDHRILGWRIHSETQRLILTKSDTTMSIPCKPAAVYQIAKVALQASLAHEGIALSIPVYIAAPYIQKGTLRVILQDWSAQPLDVHIRIKNKQLENLFQTAYLLETFSAAFVEQERAKGNRHG